MKVADKYSRIIERLVPEGNLDLKMKTILAGEVRRRLAEFEAVDRWFRQKYGMTLDESGRRGVIKEWGYAFEVERDRQERRVLVSVIC
jgi:hypothetical protein